MLCLESCDDSVLSLALQFRHRLFNKLINKGVDINLKHKYNRTLLHNEFREQNIELLISSGKISLNERDDFNLTPLDYAIGFNDKPCGIFNIADYYKVCSIVDAIKFRDPTYSFEDQINHAKKIKSEFETGERKLKGILGLMVGIPSQTKELEKIINKLNFTM